MSEIFATQLTAVAKVVLTVFAIVTAIVARFAFQKQSREVRNQAEELRAGRARPGPSCHGLRRAVAGGFLRVAVANTWESPADFYP